MCRLRLSAWPCKKLLSSKGCSCPCKTPQGGPAPLRPELRKCTCANTPVCTHRRKGGATQALPVPRGRGHVCLSPTRPHGRSWLRLGVAQDGGRGEFGLCSCPVSWDLERYRSGLSGTGRRHLPVLSRPPRHLQIFAQSGAHWGSHGRSQVRDLRLSEAAPSG